MKKIYSLFLTALMATSTFAAATVFYCDPAAQDDKTKKGSSWEQAISLNMLRTQLNGTSLTGKTIYIKGGTIRLANSDDLWIIKSGVTLIGGFDPEATGTVTELPTYPSTTPTIFNGDVNNDGQLSESDAKALFYVDFSSDTTKVITIQGIDFINTYNNVQESPEDVKTHMNNYSALRVICGTAYVKNCHFYNHVTPNNRGSQCVTIVGARLHMSDCELHDCISLTRGALLRTRNFFIGDDSTKTRQPDCVLERCCFYSGNSMGGKAMNVEGLYAGGVHASYGPVFAINCTFANNEAYTDGGGVSANESGVSFISCSFLNNYCARSENMDLQAETRNAYGSAIHDSHNAPFRLANNFVLDDKDNASKQYAPIYSDANDDVFGAAVTSGGNNVAGTFWYHKGSGVPDQSSTWLTSDIWSVPSSGKAENYATYFGTDKTMKKNGGFSKTILPLKMQNGDNVAHLQELADQWCPSWTKVDASVDQRGYKRNANVTCVGAAAYEFDHPTALPETQSAISNQQSAIYNILGQPVGASYKGIVIQNGKKYLLK